MGAWCVTYALASLVRDLLAEWQAAQAAREALSGEFDAYRATHCSCLFDDGEVTRECAYHRDGRVALQAAQAEREEKTRQVMLAVAMFGDAMNTRFRTLDQAAHKAREYYDRAVATHQTIKKLQAELDRLRAGTAASE